MSTKKLTTIGILCALALVASLMISFPIIPAASFLRYDPKDIVIVIGGFIYGPLTSLIMCIICALLELLFRGGNLIDAFMNVLATGSFTVLAAYIYKKEHTKQGAIKGMISGMVLMTVAMVLWNYIVTPIYYGWPREQVAAILVPGIIPFNLLKSGLNTLFTLVLYKPVVNILRHNYKGSNNDNLSKRTTYIALTLLVIITIILLFLAKKGAI